MKSLYLFLFIILFAGLEATIAQQRPTGQIQKDSQTLRREAEENRMRNVQQDMDQMQQHRELIGRIRTSLGAPARRLKTTKEDKKLLTPDETLKTQYAAFLKLSKTKLIKILPDNGCNYTEMVIDVSEKCQQNMIPGAGAYYSFREADYVLPTLADLRFNDKRFSVAGRLSNGFLVTLGDVPMADLNAKSDGIKFLTDLVPETLSDKVNTQMNEFQNGVRKDNYLYARSLPLNETSVYAVRIIAYRSDDLLKYRRDNKDLYDFLLLDEDKRLDITAIFRVVKVETDGSICVLWRELAHSESPKLIIADPKKK